MGGVVAEKQEDVTTSAPPPQLPLFSLTLPKSSSTHYGRWLVTPPHHAASVPFRWEEEPGKPRLSCCKENQLQLALYHEEDDEYMVKSLDLPPRLLYTTTNNNNTTKSSGSKTPSPTTVLKGPYVIGKSIFHSFRMSRQQRIRNNNGSSSGSSVSFDAAGGDELAVVVSRRDVTGSSSSRRRSFSLRLWPAKKSNKSKQRVGGMVVDEEEEECGLDYSKDSFVFSSVVDGEKKNWDTKSESETRKSTTTTSSSSLGVTKAAAATTASGSHFWANMYGAVKHVVTPNPNSRRNRATITITNKR